MNKFLRKKLMLLGLLAPLSLTGCKNEEAVEKQHITIECDSFSNNEEFDREMDHLLALDRSRESKNLYGQKLDYAYLIDFTSLSESEFIDTYTNLGLEELPDYVSFARLVDESTINNKIDLFDGKTEMTSATFKALKTIKMPDSIKKYDIPYVYRNYEINTKKLVSLEGKTYYYITSVLSFKDSIEKLGISVSSKDYLRCESLYLLDKGNFIEISRNQSGLGSVDENIVNSNFSAVKVSPIEITNFKNMSGEYTNEYAREALDTYAGTDNYYSLNNEGIDFSEYKIKTKKN